MKEVIEGLPSNKVTAGEIPIKILKERGFTFEYLTSCVNEDILCGKFPDSLKLSNIVRVHKKKDPTDKCNYRPVSILPLLSKVFEKIMYDQLYIYMNNFLNDLSKTYDWLPHDLLIAKLGTYGRDRSSLRLLMDYLHSRKQRTKVASFYSKWSEIIHGIPQGSILGPLLFNIFINDLFFVIEKSDICNFADDNTLYSCGANLKTVLGNLEHDASKLLYWFKINSMKANPEKFQFMILSKKSYQPQKLSVNTFTIN